MPGRAGQRRAAHSSLRQDGCDEVRWQEVIAETLRHFGAPHALVNSAGAARMGAAGTCTLEGFYFHTSIMSEGVSRGGKHAIPSLKVSGGGSIINILSTASHLAYPV